VSELKGAGIRVSLFVDASERFVEGAKAVGADRIELYTGMYAQDFSKNRDKAVKAHRQCAILANQIGLGINAGHDLNLENLRFYKENVPGLLEVSIGHALISDALYYGLGSTIQMYLRQLR
jgi:pyridoxine 5-phosphate synthase